MGKESKTKKSASDDQSPTSKPSYNNSVPQVIKFKNFDSESLDFSPLNKDNQKQNISYVNYIDRVKNVKTKPIFQVSKFELNSYGIPSLYDPDDPKSLDYYKDDASREFIKIGWDTNQDALNDFFQFLEKIDELADTDQFRRKIFGNKNLSKYKYIPCVKTPAEMDDDDDDEEGDDKKKKKNKTDEKEKKPKLKYAKLRFNIQYVKEGKNTKHVNSTKLVKIIDGKRENINADTITEIADQITYKSTLRFIFAISKLWSAKAPNKGSLDYGIGFKIMKIEYTPGIKSSMNGDLMEFDDSEEEDEPISPKKSGKSTKSQKFDDDDDDDVSDKKSSKKKKSNSDDEDNETEVIVGKSKGKEESKKKRSSDDDETSSSKKSSKDSKKSKSKHDEDEDEDEEKEVKPKSKSKSKKK